MPIVTLILAFLMGGVVVAATQHSVHKALLAYRDIFNGAGLNWIFHPTTEHPGPGLVQPLPDTPPDVAH